MCKLYVIRYLSASCLLSLSLLAGPVAAAGDMSQDLRLVNAARHGDVAALELLLAEQAVGVDSAQADGATALAWAVYNDDRPAIDLLIESGADVNAANDYGVTPLTLACNNRNDTAVGKLLAAGADPNRPMYDGTTSLMNCINTGSVEAVKELLAHGAKVNITATDEDQTPLMWAAAERQPEIVRLLVDQGADVNARSRIIQRPEPFIIEVPGDTVFGTNFDPAIYFRETRGGYTPLYFAARQGAVKAARILLQAGADVDYPHQEYGSALMVALAGGHEDVAMLLLEHGADPDIRNAWGMTPLHYAMQEGLLILSGYDTTPTDDFGWIRKNMPGVLQELLRRGADPAATIERTYAHTYNLFLGRGGTQSHDAPQVSPVGATPLHLAAASGDVESMRILVEAGADPKATTVGGATVFMLAVGMGAERGLRQEKPALEAAKYALSIGAGDVNGHLTDVAVDGPPQIKGRQDRRTPMHAAAYLGWPEMIRFLADNGADLNAKTRYGMTPLMIALGDPEGRYHNQLGDRKHDARFRRPPGVEVGRPVVAQTLLDAGAAPFTGEYRDRSGE